MKQLVCWAVVLLVAGLAASASAAPPIAKVHKLTVEVDVNAGELTIDQTRHDDPPQINQDDRIVWAMACDPAPCPQGAKLTVDVTEIKIDAILDLVSNRATVESNAKAAKKNVGAVYTKKDEDYAKYYKPGSPFAGPPTQLSDTMLLSGPYKGFEHELLWKFKWVVHWNGKTAYWDPHFRGHRKR